MSSVLARAVVVLEGDASKLDKMFSAAEQRMMRVGDRLSELGTTLTTRVSLPIAAMGALSFKAFGEQADAIARTGAILKATGEEASGMADHIEHLAAHLQNTTRFSDEVTQSAAGVLLTFRSVRNVAGEGNAVFDRTVRLAQDLSEVMGTDLQGAMLQLGKALENPEAGLTMLARAGVVLSDEVENQIKLLFEQGRVLEAQKLILEQLEGRIGGVAEEMAKTPLGQMKQAWNQVNEAMERAGQIINTGLQPVAAIVKSLSRAFLGLSDGMQATIVVLFGVVAAVGPFLVAMGSAMKSLTELSKVLGLSKGRMGLIVLALAAVAAAGIQIARHWTWLKQQAVSLWALLKDAFFTGVDFVLKQIQIFLQGMGELVGLIGKIPGLGKFGSWLSSPWEQGAAAVQAFRDEVALTAEESMAKSGRLIAQLENEIMGVDDSAKKATVSLQGLGKSPPPPPVWAKAAKEAMDAFSKAMQDAATFEKLLGKQFDETAAQAKAFEDVLGKLVVAGVPLDAVLGQNGETLRQLATQYMALKVQIETAAKAQQEYDDTIWRAREAVEAALTPLQVYEQVLGDLAIAFMDGKITAEQFEAAVKKAQEVLDDATKKTSELKQGLVDLAKDAVSDFVDAVFDAKTNWGDFFRTMLHDIAKLILKMIILNALFPQGGKGGLGSIFGFADGGFLGPGEIGLVGERGPELISGGRSGLTVTPMPAQGVTEGGGGGQIQPLVVNVNVSAIDSKDTARFFEENEGLVAGAMMQAFQKSSTLRRRLAGR